MDATAISLCMDNRLPIVVFNLQTPGNIKRAITGEPIGSLVTAVRSENREDVENLNGNLRISRI